MAAGSNPAIPKIICFFPGEKFPALRFFWKRRISRKWSFRDSPVLGATPVGIPSKTGVSIKQLRCFIDRRKRVTFLIIKKNTEMYKSCFV